ncbi:hypothetical protein [Streptomyces sp. CAU 1734]|uniref:hypothetical protein n=1 Tax=Streptomyces sp. CAU 1734 TaxID=3140360 RepID=UPI0032610677
MALLSAVATLLGALLICLNPPSERHHRPGMTLSPAAPVIPAVSCPYENGACGLLPVVAPAVLTGPPPEAAVDTADGPVRAGRAVVPRAPEHGRERARAPDLHVLQVLRI